MKKAKKKSVSPGAKKLLKKVIECCKFFKGTYRPFSTCVGINAMAVYPHQFKMLKKLEAAIVSCIDDQFKIVIFFKP